VSLKGRPRPYASAVRAAGFPWKRTKAGALLDCRPSARQLGQLGHLAYRLRAAAVDLELSVVAHLLRAQLQPRSASWQKMPVAMPHQAPGKLSQQLLRKSGSVLPTPALALRRLLRDSRSDVGVERELQSQEMLRPTCVRRRAPK